MQRGFRFRWIVAGCALAMLLAPGGVLASGGSAGSGGGSGSPGADTIKVSKCFYVAGNQTMLVNASSSNAAAHLLLYLPSGRFVCEVQNGGGSRYGGTVFFIGADPGTITIQSSAGGSVTVETTPFVP